MTVQTIEIEGKSYVFLPMAEFVAMQAAATGDGPANLPALPEPDADGNVPAVEYARASLARDLILARRAAGLTQAQLAKASGVRVETISRLELAKHSADPRTIDKLDKVLSKPAKPTQRTRTSARRGR